MKKPVKFVWFDVGNVIVRASHAITHAILGDLGVAPDKARLFFRGQPYQDFSRGKISPQQFAQALRKLLKCHLTDNILQLAHDAHVYAIDKKVMDIVYDLKMAEVQLSFVTNTNAWQTDHIERDSHSSIACELSLERYGKILRSHEMGMLKTDRGFWAKALLMTQIAPEDASSILFIDDNPDNIAAAKAAGLQTYLYDPTYGKGAKKLRAMLKRRGLL